MFILSSFSWEVFSLNCGGVFEAPGPSNVHVWALGLLCETLAALFSYPFKPVWPKAVFASSSTDLKRYWLKAVTGDQTQKGGLPKGGAQMVGPQGWGAQNFAFFFHSPSTISLFWCLYGCLLVEFWWPPGFHTTAREPKRAHLRVPEFKNTTKIQREDLPRVRKKEQNGGGRGAKRERNFGRSGGGRGPASGGPGESKPTTTTTITTTTPTPPEM